MNAAIAAMPDEIVLWFLKLLMMLNSGASPKDIAWRIANMGPEDPCSCTCEPEHIARNDFDRWIHENHILYNDIMWTFISVHPGLMAKLRRVVKNDAVLAAKDSNATIWVEGYQPKLLEGFFSNTPTWTKQSEKAAA